MMIRLAQIDIAWGLLVALALATVAVSSAELFALVGNALVLSLAAVKGRKIALDYLGLRAVPGPWRALVTSWVIALAVFAWLAAAARSLI